MPANPYNKARFILGATSLSQLPADEGREIAFAGRSNAGKSSVLNAICGNNHLARTSKTPGRTRQLNCFAIDPLIRLVDLPGYGFARVPDRVKRQWGQVLQAYFAKRRSLVGLFLIMDSRHPLKPFDCQLLNWCHAAGLPVHVLLNKADKLSRAAAGRTLQAVRQQLESDLITVQLFSVSNLTGLEDARSHLTDWLFPETN